MKGASFDEDGNVVHPEADDNAYFDPETPLDFSDVEYETPGADEQAMLEAMLRQDSITVGTEG